MQGIDLGLHYIGAQLDIALLKIKGFLDTTTSSEVSNKLKEILNKGEQKLIVDMSNVNYVSSAGWGVFVGEIRTIRERGGDLKIVQMTPDVYEVFEMLEFNRILEYYETIEESVNDFDISMGIDITQSTPPAKKEVDTKADDFTAPIQRPHTTKIQKTGERRQKSRFAFKKPEVDEAVLPLPEKIKAIVVDNPNDGPFKIKKKLNTQRFGFENVSIIKLYKIMKNYSLETKEKRYRYFRSR